MSVTQPAAGDVESDPAQPRPEPLRAAKRIDLHECLDRRLLHHVIDDSRPAKQPAADATHHRQVTLQEHTKAITVTGSDPRYEHSVRQGYAIYADTGIMSHSRNRDGEG